VKRASSGGRERAAARPHTAKRSDATAASATLRAPMPTPTTRTKSDEFTSNSLILSACAKHGVEDVIAYVARSARPRATSLASALAACAKLTSHAPSPYASDVILALEIIFRDTTGALATFIAPDVVEPTRAQALVRALGRADVATPSNDDDLASWLRVVVDVNSNTRTHDMDERRRHRRRSERTSSKSSTGERASSTSTSTSTFASTYARCRKASALLDASARARKEFEMYDESQLKSRALDEGEGKALKSEWRRCASAFRAAKAECEAFVNASTSERWVREASCEMSRDVENDAKAIRSEVREFGTRATASAALACERWNRLLHRYAESVRDDESAEGKVKKKCLREFLKVYDVTGSEGCQKARDDVERASTLVELGERARAFLLDALQRDFLDDARECAAAQNDVHDKVDQTVDRALRSFEVRAEAAERDARLECTERLLVDASRAFRRAQLVVAEASFADDVASFDYSRSFALAQALVATESLEVLEL